MAGARPRNCRAGGQGLLQRRRLGRRPWDCLLRVFELAVVQVADLETVSRELSPTRAPRTADWVRRAAGPGGDFPQDRQWHVDC